MDWDGRLHVRRGNDPSRSAHAAPTPNLVDLATIDARVVYDHRGSEMLIDHERGLIVYSVPKPSLAGIFVPGQVLFRGTIPEDGRSVEGEAHVFRKGCSPAPYRVTGAFADKAERPTLVLRVGRRAERKAAAWSWVIQVGIPARRSSSPC